MDDTDLGRPPRHERPHVHRKDPRGVQTATVDGAAQRPCGTCGEPVDLSFAGPVPEFLREMAQRQLAGTAPVECAVCGAKREADEEAAERQAALLERISTRRAAAGIPPKWAVQTFETLDRAKGRATAITRAEEWSRAAMAAPRSNGLVLWGPVGRGKTAIAAAAANMRLARSAVRWLPVAELLLDLSAGFESPERARALRRLDASHGSAALVLDDLDKMKPSEWAVGPLFLAINRWVEAELPLLVTLNRDIDALEAWLPDTYGEPIASRLAGYCRIYEVGGVDRRLT